MSSVRMRRLGDARGISPTRWRNVRPYSSGMEPARPLHSVFAELTGERGFAQASGPGPDEVLAAQGHRDLPEGLVAEAVVNYADTAPFEVAEHLAPYVRANSAVPQAGAQTTAEEPHWYSLLTTAPPVTGLAAGHDVLDAEASALAGAGPVGETDLPAEAAGEIDVGFGHGHQGAAEHPAPDHEPAGGETTPVWSATTEPSFEGFDADPDIDTRLLSDDVPDATTDDEPDAIDG